MTGKVLLPSLKYYGIKGAAAGLAICLKLKITLTSDLGLKLVAFTVSAQNTEP